MTVFDVDPDRAGLPDAWLRMCQLLDRYGLEVPADGEGRPVARCRRCPDQVIAGRRFGRVELGYRADTAMGELVTQVLRHEVEAHTGERFRCPDCGALTGNANDVRERYCPACHWWTGNPELREGRRTARDRRGPHW